MPELIKFVPAIEPEKKSKNDITSGKVSKEGRILSWKSDAIIDPAADLIESELKKHKKNAETSKVDSTQKSDNVIKMGEANIEGRSQAHYHTRQETLSKLERLSRKAKKRIKPVEGEMWNSVFEDRAS